MEKLIHLRWLELSGNSLNKDDLEIICKLYFLQTLLLSNCSLKEIPPEMGNLVKLRRLDLNFNEQLKEVPESMCRLVELQILNLNGCKNLHALPERIHRLRNLQRLLIMDTPASRCLPRGLGELSGLRTLATDFYGGCGCNKLGLLKKLNGLGGSLTLEMKFTSSRDLEELVEDAREAELRSKIHIRLLQIRFEKDEVEWSLSSSSSSLWMDVMEALEPNQRKLNELVIWGYRGSRLPQWVSSPLCLVKEISLCDFDELSSLPPLGKLPFLEFLYASEMKVLKFVGREFLGIESSSSSSSTSNDVVVAFPRLKHLAIGDLPKWSEWEDITAEEEESILVSLVPCLEELHISKASSTLRILNIVDSPVLQNQYGDKDGSHWRSISQYNPHLGLYSY